MNEGKCNEPTVGFLHPIINEESENLNPQEIKESKTRLKNPVKTRKRKKKTEEKLVSKTQKALFPETE